MAWWLWVLIAYFGINLIIAIFHLIMVFIDFAWEDFWYYFPIHGMEALCILFVGIPLFLILLFEG